MPREANRHYISIETDGEARTVWSVEMRKSGDLLIFIPATGRYLDSRKANVSEMHNTVITQQRYSIHMSSMPDHNMIKYTVEAGEKQTTTVHFTKAVKRTNLFAPLFCQITPRSLSRLKARTNAAVHNIGRYEPEIYSLYFCIFVGRAERAFMPTTDWPFRNLSFKLGSFSLVMLYSFISMPSSEGRIFHFATLDPASLTESEGRLDMERFINGLQDVQAATLFLHQGYYLCEQIVKEVWSKQHLTDVAARGLELRDFWTEGYRGSPSWNAMVLRAAGKPTIDEA